MQLAREEEENRARLAREVELKKLTAMLDKERADLTIELRELKALEQRLAIESVESEKARIEHLENQARQKEIEAQMAENARATQELASATWARAAAEERGNDLLEDIKFELKYP